MGLSRVTTLQWWQPRTPTDRFVSSCALNGKENTKIIHCHSHRSFHQGLWRQWGSHYSLYCMTSFYLQGSLMSVIHFVIARLCDVPLYRAQCAYFTRAAVVAELRREGFHVEASRAARHVWNSNGFSATNGSEPLSPRHTYTTFHHLRERYRINKQNAYSPLFFRLYSMRTNVKQILVPFVLLSSKLIASNLKVRHHEHNLFASF